MAIYRALGITHQRIDPGQPWQSYIETSFNVQRRMADWDFGQARSWEELGLAHERWRADFNTQVHWAHQKRTDGRRSPAEVLGWATGQPISEEELERAFTVRFERSLDQQGYARFRNWRIYGERGLNRKRVILWLCEEQLRVEFDDTPLAEYRVAYRQDHQHLRTIDPTRRYETRHQSPQLPFLELDPQDWRLVIELPPSRRRLRPRGNVVQASLFPLEEAGERRE
jgi:hypothetical protein